MHGKGSAFTAVLMLLAIDAHAGVIRGRVALQAMPSSASTADGPQVVVGVEQAVVWVDSLPASVAAFYRAIPRRARVAESQRLFNPGVTVVTAGTTIQFVNRDKVYHNVFSVSPARRFDIGKYAPHASRAVVFDTTGVVNLFCEIHPWMAGWVVVLPHRVFARPDRIGRFQLPWLPPGRYRVHVWHPNHGEQTRLVDLPERGDAVVALND
jgi:plastocyanin